MQGFKRHHGGHGNRPHHGHGHGGHGGQGGHGGHGGPGGQGGQGGHGGQGRHGGYGGRGGHGRHDGPRDGRPDRPRFRDFRGDSQPASQPAAAPKALQEIPVTQARGLGHMRIMGKIEYDVRTILKIADVPDDQTLLYLACAREFYADYENCKGDKLEPALDNTMTKWIERGYKADIVKRIRTRVTDVYHTLKTQKQAPPKPEPAPAPAPEPEEEELEVEPGFEPDPESQQL